MVFLPVLRVPWQEQCEINSMLLGGNQVISCESANSGDSPLQCWLRLIKFPCSIPEVECEEWHDLDCQEDLSFLSGSSGGSAV